MQNNSLLENARICGYKIESLSEISNLIVGNCCFESKGQLEIIDKQNSKRFVLGSFDKNQWLNGFDKEKSYDQNCVALVKPFPEPYLVFDRFTKKPL